MKAIDIEAVKTKKSISLKKDAVKYREKLSKRGVIYLSKIPPFMKPNKVRTLFEVYGEVTRLFLSEEDESRRKKRIHAGGNGSKQFVEGWVEFADKDLAKQVASTLNNSAIGGKKGNFYHDDIWNIKYLKNFKWDYLTEKLAYERRVREQKLRVAMMQSKRQNAEYVELLDKQKTEQFIQERKRKRDDGIGESHSQSTEIRQSNGVSGADSRKFSKLRRRFRQVKPIGKVHGEDEARPDSAVLRHVFAKPSYLPAPSHK